MKRRTFLVGLGAAAGVSACGQGISEVSARPVDLGEGGLLELPLRLPGAGRIAFYIDYSERTSLGTHRFYVQRIFGTTGAVSVRYQTFGDAHDRQSGTITWADGRADIHRIEVPVRSKPDGSHRMYIQLSDPTGGATLHFGDFTRAYGVIDDGTFKAGAIYFDADAATNGTGTRESPFNTIYAARDAVGTSGTIYGRGTQTVTANEGRFFGAPRLGIIPPTGTDDANRVHIERWPGASTFTIRGTGSLDHAFDAGETEGVGSWVTYRGIDFNTVTAGIRHTYNEAQGVNVERCTFRDINNTNQGPNVAGVLPWGISGVKIWRCTFDNIQANGDNTNSNTAGVQTYDGTEISVQRCRFSRCYAGTYHKRQATTSDVSMSSKFNIYDGVRHYYGDAGGIDPYNWSVICNNLFINGVADGGSVATRAIELTTGTNEDNGTSIGLWAHNVFDGHRYAIEGNKGFKSPILYNNVFANLGLYQYAAWIGDQRPAYSDHNWVYRGGSNGFYLNDALRGRADLCREFGLECNTTDGTDPQFAAESYTVAGAAATGGVNGTPVGPYLLGIETIGPD